MGSPDGAADREAAKNDWAGLAVREYVTMRYPTETQILDVGAGWGKYRDLLPEYPHMDACEVWEPYIEEEKLHERYEVVHHADVTLLVDMLSEWDLLIFGDVLEHLKRPDAQAVLAKCRNAVVVVPFRYPQGEEEGNPYEYHWQADLTPQLMMQLYPELQLKEIEWRGRRPFKGLYVKEQ